MLEPISTCHLRVDRLHKLRSSSQLFESPKSRQIEFATGLIVLLYCWGKWLSCGGQTCPCKILIAKTTKQSHQSFASIFRGWQGATLRNAQGSQHATFLIAEGLAERRTAGGPHVLFQLPAYQICSCLVLTYSYVYGLVVIDRPVSPLPTI